ncbi:MAG: CARDB domain-containing protein [bacterium]
MKTIKLFLRSVVLLSAVILPAVLVDSCGFCASVSSPFCKLLGETPLAELTDSSSSMVLLSQDTLVVYHGSACAKSTKSGTKDVIKIEGIRELPAFATNAAVFLNGWKLQYLDGDHHVDGMGATIRNIRLEEIPEKRVLALKWEATGIISDKNFDDSYSLCYNYTVVAWSEKTVSLVVDQDDGSCGDTDPINANFFGSDNANTTTALSTYKSFLFNPAFVTSPDVAILPRGFGMVWYGGCDVDHHLLQIAYNIDHSERSMTSQRYKKALTDFDPILPSNSGRMDSGFVSWETHAIYKDNDGRRAYGFGEMVSGLGGDDVSIIDPPYSILPHEDDCDGATGHTKQEEYVVKNIPYKFAIPILTGWELGYVCDDEHITKAGIRIDNWNYSKDPLTGKGVLTYKLSSDFSDKNDDNPDFRSHNITILGIKPLQSLIKSTSATDLIPVMPPGTRTNSFCRMDAAGNLLLVTIKNQGNKDAGPSMTTVMFGSQRVNVNTPPIKAGESAELQFRFPANCFDPDCEFTIIADFEKQVDEGDNEKNNSVSDICKPVIL